MPTARCVGDIGSDPHMARALTTPRAPDPAAIAVRVGTLSAQTVVVSVPRESDAERADEAARGLRSAAGIDGGPVRERPPSVDPVDAGPVRRTERPDGFRPSNELRVAHRRTAHRRGGHRRSARPLVAAAGCGGHRIDRAAVVAPCRPGQEREHGEQTETCGKSGPHRRNRQYTARPQSGRPQTAVTTAQSDRAALVAPGRGLDRK
jgi:hypothetical protein